MNTERLFATLRRMLVAVAPMVALSGAVSLTTGCAGDSYYCDSMGCYYCDGTGCRGAMAPTPRACVRDSECASGQVCTSLGCLNRGCTTDRDCGNGFACVTSGDARYCAPPRSTPTPVTPGCSTNAQCVAGEVCLNGRCVASTTPGCTADAMCTGGRVCVSGRCVDRATTCQFDNQCGAGRVCVNNECRQGCGAGGACPTGQECATVGSAMYCRDRAATGCTSNAMCGANEACLNGRCYPQCTPGGAPACAAELYCSDDRVCVPDTRPRPLCDASRPCAAGSECVAGICRVACTSSTMCQSVAVTYRNCGPIPYVQGSRNYCLTDSEARPTCARQADCSAGQVCVDGNCR